MNKDYTNKEYADYIKKKSPKSRTVRDTARAFLVGGLICAFAQAAANYMEFRGVDAETLKNALPVIMVGLGALFTGAGLYEKLAKFGGAGTIVPITGFANAVVSPAMEFKTEGHVLGAGAKMFVIAGPVIVFGTIASVAVGLIYFLFG
ncbi:MAG: SpoVA/SpoVAEb family sporulation membrane protein [Clostridiales bacterium]|jgi:stage V sporulation protein AC|nr:SpoVA/SpoVAEb family sporulation membrane protein [Clostridiales bacterium]